MVKSERQPDQAPCQTGLTLVHDLSSGGGGGAGGKALGSEHRAPDDTASVRTHPGFCKSSENLPVEVSAEPGGSISPHNFDTF